MIESAADMVLDVAPTVVAYTWDAIWAAAKAIAGVKPLSPEAVVPLIAIGGEISRDTVVKRNALNQLWADVFWYYKVNVGSETRSILLASCRLPVEAIPTIIITHEATNNKKLTLSNGIWTIWDTEENRFDTPLKHVEQDAEWLYANEVDNNNNVLNKHRFAMAGDGWQTISGGRW